MIDTHLYIEDLAALPSGGMARLATLRLLYREVLGGGGGGGRTQWKWKGHGKVFRSRPLDGNEETT